MKDRLHTIISLSAVGAVFLFLVVITLYIRLKNVLIGRDK